MTVTDLACAWFRRLMVGSVTSGLPKAGQTTRTCRPGAVQGGPSRPEHAPFSLYRHRDGARLRAERGGGPPGAALGGASPGGGAGALFLRHRTGAGGRAAERGEPAHGP